MYGRGDDLIMLDGPKPHLRFWRGVWWCGYRGEHTMYWACDRDPCRALELWRRSRSTS